MGTFVQSVLNIEGNGRCEVKEPDVIGTSCMNVPSISSLHDKFDDHNFRFCVEAHGGSPGAGPAGGINQKVTKPFEPIIVTLVDLRGDEPEEKNLSLVCVTGKLG
jgi:hypothetical protein